MGGQVDYLHHNMLLDNSSFSWPNCYRTGKYSTEHERMGHVIIGKSWLVICREHEATPMI